MSIHIIDLIQALRMATPAQRREFRRLLFADDQSPAARMLAEIEARPATVRMPLKVTDGPDAPR